MNQCKRCNSEDLTYKTNYEHLDFESECSVFSNGYECESCGCFHSEEGDYYEYFSSYEENKTPSYLQIMN